MASSDPAERRRIAGRAGNCFAARRTPEQLAEHTARARAGKRMKLVHEVDPDGVLARTNPAELERRVQEVHRARMAAIGRLGGLRRAERLREAASA